MNTSKKSASDYSNKLLTLESEADRYNVHFVAQILKQVFIYSTNVDTRKL